MRELTKFSLAGPIEDLCLLVEKHAMIFRLNNIERPSSTYVPLRDIREAARNNVTTLAQEFEKLSTEVNATRLSIPRDQFLKAIKNSERDILMNKEAHHSFWARMDRLKTDSLTFSKQYKFTQVTREELITFIRATPVRNVADVENFIFVAVMDEVKKVFCEELVPLFSNWIAYYVHSGYEISYQLSLNTKNCLLLRKNAKFEQVFKKVLHQIYFEDVRDLINMNTSQRTPAFLERINVLRDNRDKMYSMINSMNNWVNKVSQYKNDVPSDRLTIFPLKTFETDIKPSYISENPSPTFTPQFLLTLTNDEHEWLNKLAEFTFEQLLEECVQFFFREAETSLDFLYSDTRYHEEKDFLFKKLFFSCYTMAAEDEQYEDIIKELDSIPPWQRYEGYDLQQLLNDGILKFTKDTPDILNFGSKSNPFEGINIGDLKIPDFTYKEPRARIPGYRKPLHDNVKQSARKFLGIFFADIEHQRKTIMSEAIETRTKYDQLEIILQELKTAYAEAFPAN